MNSNKSFYFIIEEINIILTVAKHLHFRNAAEELHKSPSSVSRIVSRVEDYFNTTIFIRNNRNVMISDNGYAILSRLRMIKSFLTDELEETDVLVEKLSAKLEAAEDKLRRISHLAQQD